MNKKIILFDIDYTLFDTTVYKKAVAQKLAEKVLTLDQQKAHEVIEEVYYDVRSFGSFDPNTFAQFFLKKLPSNISEKEIEEVWWQQDVIQSAIYPEVIPVLTDLQKRENILLGIFSSGRNDFQKAKISVLEDFFHTDHIHIASFKEETITELVYEYKNDQTIFVDDYVGILSDIKKLKPDTMVIWMKRGRFAEKAKMPENFKPDAIITNLTELPALVDRDSMV